MRTAEPGKGALEVQGPNHHLNGASVTLTRDGRADFIFTSEKECRLSGTWRQGKANQTVIAITLTYGRVPAIGTGAITFFEGSFFPESRSKAVLKLSAAC
ncbi:MAG: hypothetical protein ACI8T1_004469 [Verrucomicrobiales bacterium]|jgi:hypothetical protein